MGYGQGGYGLGNYGLEESPGGGGGGGGTTTIYVFEPPTHEEPMRTEVAPLYYFRLTWANSIVRISGVFTSIRTPAFEVIEDAGQHGVDWFRGGYVYEVSEATKAELEAAGFTVRTETVTEPDDPTPPPPGDPDGFGEGGYGSGNYGE